MKFLTANKLWVLLLAACLFLSVAWVKKHKKYQYDFQDPSLSVEQRVNDLVSKMTLDEKVGQMLNAAPAIDRVSCAASGTMRCIAAPRPGPSLVAHSRPPSAPMAFAHQCKPMP